MARKLVLKSLNNISWQNRLDMHYMVDDNPQKSWMDQDQR